LINTAARSTNNLVTSLNTLGWPNTNFKSKDILNNKTEYLNINDNVGSGINLSSLETKIIQLDRSTSNSELDIVSSVSAYPNPAQNLLNIDILGINLNKTYQVKIYNLLGEVKMEETIKAHQNNVLNIEELCSGIYFIKTEGGNTVKFVKN
jgi:hypothetical protein